MNQVLNVGDRDTLIYDGESVEVIVVAIRCNGYRFKIDERGHPQDGWELEVSILQ